MRTAVAFDPRNMAKADRILWRILLCPKAELTSAGTLLGLIWGCRLGPNVVRNVRM